MITQAHVSFRTFFQLQISRMILARRFHSARSGVALATSLARGPSMPLVEDTIGTRLRIAAEAAPDHTCFYFHHQNKRVTYQQFYQDSRAFAASLYHLGLRRGDRVGAWGPNQYEWMVCKYGTAMAGMIQVNINPAYQMDELKYALNKVGVSCLVSPRSFGAMKYLDMLHSIAQPTGTGGVVSSKEVPSLKHLIVFGEDEVSGAWQMESLSSDSNDVRMLEEEEGKIDCFSPVNIQYTSGTTGSPKAATLSHHNIVNNAVSCGVGLGMHQGHHSICLPLPMYHCFGCVVGALNSVIFHNTCVFPSARFDGAAVVEAIEQEKCNWIMGTPSMYIDMIAQPNAKQRLATLKNGAMGGAPCPVALCERLVEEFDMNGLRTAFGTTETSPAVSMTHLTEPPLERIKSVGVPLHNIELDIVDAEGKRVPIGEKGQLRARGYAVMLGYWGDEERTKKEINEEGWYHTGDVATMSPSGAVSICGRSKDLIIRGGENIYPTEVENVIFKLGYVKDVQVVGVPDARLGEKVCAWIILKKGVEKTKEDVLADCRGKMASFKLPEYVVFAREGDFPTTVTGKVQKFRLAELSKQRLGL